jgi:hypothetical protein
VCSKSIFTLHVHSTRTQHTELRGTLHMHQITSLNHTQRVLSLPCDHACVRPHRGVCAATASHGLTWCFTAFLTLASFLFS